MKVLHLNIRAAQGGAGKVMIDLHRRMRDAEINSRAAYGYASGITDDPAVISDETVVRLGSRTAVLVNYMSHLLIGREAITCNRNKLQAMIAECDVIHLHCPHHYYMSWTDFLAIAAVERKPIVATAHDWWFVTGRCGFIGDCGGWRRSCGECGDSHKGDLPTLFDISRQVRRRKIASIDEFGTSFQFVCPSEHLAKDYRSVFSRNPVHVVPNFLDLDFENGLKTPGSDSERPAYLISASDLSYTGKVDPSLVTELLKRSVPLQAMGRNNPFSGPGFDYLGEVRSRQEVLTYFRAAHALIFCSTVDNAPLTIIEALSAGCYVLAYSSPAAREMLAAVGGRCVEGRDEMLSIIESGNIADLYDGIERSELAARARSVYSGSQAVSSYSKIYSAAIAT